MEWAIVWSYLPSHSIPLKAADTATFSQPFPNPLVILTGYTARRSFFQREKDDMENGWISEDRLFSLTQHELQRYTRQYILAVKEL
jgi:hypothetical protein